MKKVFNHTQNQEEFNQNGYVKFQLLDTETSNELLKYYYALTDKIDVKNSVYGIYVSLDEKDKSLKTEVMDFLQKSIQPKLDTFLKDYKVHLGGFIVKQADNYSYTYPHQDWTFVANDDSESFSATIWISLNDLTPEMGSLGFIKGSHRFLDGIVGSPSSHFKNATQGHEELLFQYLTFPEVSAGDALMFNNKCVHGANPNQSANARVIVGIGVTPKESNLYHYFLKPGTTNKVLKLKVGEDFFMDYMNDDLINTYNNGEIPSNCIIEKEFEFMNTAYSATEMINLITANGNIKNSFSIIRPQMQEAEHIELIENKETNKPAYTLPKIDFDKVISFFKIYTPYNIYKESKFRLTGKY